MALYSSDPGWVPQLAGLLSAPAGAVPEGLQALALRGLAAQLADRARHAPVVAALGGAGGGGGGLLALLLHAGVAGLTGEGRMPGQLAHGPAWVEALLALASGLVPSTSGCEALADAGLVPALLPLLRHTAPEHLPVVASAVRVLESFMDFRWGGTGSAQRASPGRSARAQRRSPAPWCQGA